MIRVAVVVIAALLGVLTLTGLTALAIGVGNTRMVADSVELPGSVRKLTIDVGDVPMRIRISTDSAAASPRAELRFVSMAPSSRRSLEVTSDADGAQINVAGERPRWMRWARAGDLHIVLPPGLGGDLSVHSTQRFGVFELDTDVRHLVARTDHGAVLLRGSADTVEATNRHGTVRSLNPVAVRESFTASTVHGEVDVEFRDFAPERVDVSSETGSVTVGLPGSGPFLVNASAGGEHGNSRVRVPQTTDQAEAVATITARSGNGAVTVKSND